jgi:hypothetical protein
VQRQFDRGQLDGGSRSCTSSSRARTATRAKADAQNMPWRSSTTSSAATATDKPLRESGYKRFNVLAPRWDVAGGDIYGNSPGMEALGDVKQLQQEQLRKSQGIDYMSNPPLQVPTS